MGIGKSLKKFVKKALPVAAAVAPFTPFAPLAPILGAAAGGAKGGLKGALLGGIGGYAAGQFGQGFTGAMGDVVAGRTMAPTFLQRLSGGLGQLKTGFGMGPGGGITKLINRFTGAAQAGVPSNEGLVAGQPLPGASGTADRVQGPWSWGPHKYLQPGKESGSKFLLPGFAEEGAGNAIDNAVQESIVNYEKATGGGGTWGGLVDFAKNAFNEKNLPLTAGLLGGLAQMWENKTGEKPGQVSWGEGLDYHSPVRGTQIHGDVLTTPAAANGGRIGFANGGDLYFGDEGEQSLYRDLVRVFTGEITGAEARAIMEAAQGDLGSKAIEMAKQEASYKPMANGGRMRFANGNEVDPEYEGWKKMYNQNKAIGMTHPNAAEYLKRLEKEQEALQEVDIKARGGIIGLANGGEPAYEMDLRGGGFIPVGAYERADDVPARVSKNEFVMTADAVRAAGGGSIDRGSQRMYDLMNSLEAQA